MSGVIKTIILVIVLIVILAVVALVIGPCVYYTWFDKPDTGRPDMPDIEEATHSFYIENSGGLILASDYEQIGDVVGSRIFVLHGFWELRGKDFKFVAGEVVLDENIFGKITMKRRG